MSACARCEHPEIEHTRVSGPNSIGQYTFGGCHHAWSEAVGFDGIYLLEQPSSCECPKFEDSKIRYWLRQLWKRITRRRR